MIVLMEKVDGVCRYFFFGGALYLIYCIFVPSPSVTRGVLDITGYQYEKYHGIIFITAVY